MVEEEQDEVMYMESVQRWRPSQGTGQDRVDRPGTGGEQPIRLVGGWCWFILR
jgi:hypothetical protein